MYLLLEQMFHRTDTQHQTMPMTKEAMDIQTQRSNIHIHPTTDLIKGITAIPTRLMIQAMAMDQRIMAIPVDQI